MLSIDLIRQKPAQVREGLGRRGEEEDLTSLLNLDESWRALVSTASTLRAERNQVSKEIGGLIRGGSKAEAETLQIKMRDIGSKLTELENDRRVKEQELRDQMLMLPNLPLPGVPPGLDSSGNIVVKEAGVRKEFDFPLYPHWELSEKLGITDMERAAKISGSRFVLFAETGARLQRALTSWMLDFHREKHGYREVGVPFLVRRETMVRSANLPRFMENLYRDEEDDLWLIPTAEVPLTSLHSEEIVDSQSLPLRYMAHSSCFRREKTAAGRDVRGIKRVHQFEKVEMYQFVHPSKSDDALQEIIGHAEEICRQLEIPYRVLQLCAGDLGFPSAQSYDLELWAPASKEWLEVSSCSNCTDFQARRANIRFRPEPNRGPEFLHTLNGSGLAIPRVMISILENYQTADGSMIVPKVLQPYLGQAQLNPVK